MKLTQAQEYAYHRMMHDRGCGMVIFTNDAGRKCYRFTKLAGLVQNGEKTYSFIDNDGNDQTHTFPLYAFLD